MQYKKINQIEKSMTEIIIESTKRKLSAMEKEKSKLNKWTRRRFKNRNSKVRNERKTSEF